MFDVFGNFDSVEELNACAKGLLEEQDLEHLKVLAEENGIPDGIREVYEQHLSEELVDLVNAAIGKLQVELKEETDGMPAGEIVSYLSMRCFEKEALARAIRRKNRTLKECLQNIRCICLRQVHYFFILFSMYRQQNSITKITSIIPIHNVPASIIITVHTAAAASRIRNSSKVYRIFLLSLKLIQ